MSNMLTHPYCNESRKAEIENIHLGLHGAMVDVAARLRKAATKLSPLDILAHPDANGFPKITNLVLDDIKNCLINSDPYDENPKTMVQWDSFGVYNRIQCAVMKKVHQYVAAAIYYLQLDLDTIPTISNLQRLGLLAMTSSTALATKIMWLYYVEHLQILGRPGDWFMGNVSVTTPVKKYFKHIHRLSGVSIHEANRYTFELAQACDMTPVDINTAMWCIGRDC
jgi:hypothetical protein